MGHPIRLELTSEGLLDKLGNHYTTWSAQIKSRVQPHFKKFDLNQYLCWAKCMEPINNCLSWILRGVFFGHYVATRESQDSYRSRFVIINKQVFHLNKKGEGILNEHLATWKSQNPSRPPCLCFLNSQVVPFYLCSLNSRRSTHLQAMDVVFHLFIEM